jgi:hypothetical protein
LILYIFFGAIKAAKELKIEVPAQSLSAQVWYLALVLRRVLRVCLFRSFTVLPRESLIDRFLLESAVELSYEITNYNGQILSGLVSNV